MAYCIKGI